MDFKKCTKSFSKKIIPITGNRMTFKILNPGKKRVNQVQVDGCLIDDNRIRCDYLFEINSPMSLVFYVELKGKNIEKALKQLEATIGYCKTRHNGLEKECYIVASRVPKEGPKVQNIRKKFKRKYDISIYVSTIIKERAI
jgi:hypothetical protein